MWIFWIVTPCEVVGRYLHIGETYSLHLQPWRRWYVPKCPHGIKTQNKIDVFTAVMSSNLINWAMLFLFMSVRWYYVSEQRSPDCSAPRWYMRMKSHGGLILTGGNRRTQKSLSQYHFVHKSHMDWPGTNPGLCGPPLFLILLFKKTRLVNL
jgi:hypothetical protein